MNFFGKARSWWERTRNERLLRRIQEYGESEEAQRTMDVVTGRMNTLIDDAFKTDHPEVFLESHIMQPRGTKKKYVQATERGGLKVNIQILQSLIKTEEAVPSDTGARLDQLKRTLEVYKSFFNDAIKK